MVDAGVAVGGWAIAPHADRTNVRINSTDRLKLTFRACIAFSFSELKYSVSPQADGYICLIGAGWNFEETHSHNILGDD